MTFRKRQHRTLPQGLFLLVFEIFLKL